MRLRVGAPPTFTRNLLIPRLPEFYREWPDIEIDVAIAAPMDARPERHDIDIRFGDGRFDDRHAGKLFDDTVVALASPTYPAQHGLRTPQDLSRAHLLRSPLVPWRPWFAAAGLDWPEPHRGLTFSDLGILLEAAASGLGVAVSTRRVAEGWTRDALLEPLFGVEVASVNGYYTLVDRTHLDRPEVVAFLDWLGDVFARP
jgi:DNA-binding transcriptional LysR family regulator